MPNNIYVGDSLYQNLEDKQEFAFTLISFIKVHVDNFDMVMYNKSSLILVYLTTLAPLKMEVRQND